MEKGQGSGTASGAVYSTAQGNQQSVVIVTANPQPVPVTGRPAYRDRDERIAVPAMPMPAAVVCCILNFLIPGFGTICAGFSSFCCSRNEDIDFAGRCVSCLIGWGIGCAQMILFILCLVGWFWSCAWGIFFIGMSAEYYHNNRIAADGGYINHRPGQNGVIVGSVVTNQPTTSYIQQPVGPPPYSNPPAGQENVIGSLPVNPTAPPPPYPY